MGSIYMPAQLKEAKQQREGVEGGLGEVAIFI